MSETRIEALRRQIEETLASSFVSDLCDVHYSSPGRNITLVCQRTYGGGAIVITWEDKAP